MMKNKILKGTLFCFLLFSFISCEKENLNDENITIEKNIGIFQVQNGVIVLQDYEQLEKLNSHLSSLSIEEMQKWELQYNFLSLASIDRKINEAEVQHQETFFKGVDPNLSSQEYKALGYNYQHTSIYKKYLDKGVIERKIEKDGAISTELSVKNVAFIYVLNEEGKVIVGDELLVFSGNETMVYDRNTMSLLHNSSNDSNSQFKINGLYNFNKGTGTASNRWITDPAKGSNYRYKGEVIFTSSYTTSTLSQTFYWAARAEQKRFGSWNTRNTYNPIWGCAANWSYDYWIIYPGAGFGTVRDGSVYPLPNSSGKPTSPYYVSNLNTNYTVRALQFSSMYSINPASIGYSFFENVRVYNYNFVFKYSGGPSGYNYTAH